MLVIVNYGGRLSPKARFVVQLFSESSDERFFYVFRKGNLQFREKFDYNQAELATSVKVIFAYFFLMFLKSPRDLRDGLLVRLSHRQSSSGLVQEGSLSALSNILYKYLVVSSRTEGLLRFLNNVNSPKVFLIDEFSSVKLVDLKILKRIGKIVYVSQDVAYNCYSFAKSFTARKLVFRFERDVVMLADVVIACSERDKVKYLEMGAQKAFFYPNIYPIEGFEPDTKDLEPSICIVLRNSWGASVNGSLEEILKALSFINKKVRVCLIGIKAKQVPRNVILQNYQCIPSKMEYLRILSKSWIGINVGVHLGGTNERKYDYAMAGDVVVSDNFGSRGDLLPHEYSYVDTHDLAAKIYQLLEFGRERLSEMGMQNRKQAISLAEEQRKRLSEAINNIE